MRAQRLLVGLSLLKILILLAYGTTLRAQTLVYTFSHEPRKESTPKIYLPTFDPDQDSSCEDILRRAAQDGIKSWHFDHLNLDQAFSLFSSVGKMPGLARQDLEVFVRLFEVPPTLNSSELHALKNCLQLMRVGELVLNWSEEVLGYPAILAELGDLLVGKTLRVEIDPSCSNVSEYLVALRAAIERNFVSDRAKKIGIILKIVGDKSAVDLRMVVDLAVAVIPMSKSFAIIGDDALYDNTYFHYLRQAILTRWGSREGAQPFVFGFEIPNLESRYQVSRNNLRFLANCLPISGGKKFPIEIYGLEKASNEDISSIFGDAGKKLERIFLKVEDEGMSRAAFAENLSRLAGVLFPGIDSTDAGLLRANDQFSKFSKDFMLIIEGPSEIISKVGDSETSIQQIADSILVPKFQIFARVKDALRSKRERMTRESHEISEELARLEQELSRVKAARLATSQELAILETMIGGPSPRPSRSPSRAAFASPRHSSGLPRWPSMNSLPVASGSGKGSSSSGS